jgi:Zeta toxin
MPHENSNHQLTEEESNSRYQRLCKKWFKDTHPREVPIFVTIVGVNASGKSWTASRVVRKDFKNRGGAVLVDMDLILYAHPDYKKLLADPDTRSQAFELVSSDTRVWQRRLTEDGIAERRNIVRTNTFMGPWSLEYFGNVHEAGFRHHVWVIAANEMIIRRRHYQRYERQTAVVKMGRLHPPERDRAVYTELIDTLRAAESMGADQIVILRGYQQPVYDSLNEPTPGSAVKFLQEELKQPLTRAEGLEHLAGWDEVLMRMYARNAPSRDIEFVTRLVRADTFRLLSSEEGISRFSELAEAYRLLTNPKRLAKQDRALIATSADSNLEQIAKWIEQGYVAANSKTTKPQIAT